jgi:hypothetical protein
MGQGGNGILTEAEQNVDMIAVLDVTLSGLWCYSM